MTEEEERARCERAAMRSLGRWRYTFDTQEEYDCAIKTSLESHQSERAEAFGAGRKAQSQVPCMHYAAVDAMQRAVAAAEAELSTCKAKLARVEALLDDTHLDGYETREALRAALADSGEKPKALQDALNMVAALMLSLCVVIEIVRFRQ